MSYHASRGPIYYTDTPDGYDVHMRGEHIGTIILGEVSVYYRAQSGGGKLYANVARAIAALIRAAYKEERASAIKKEASSG